MTARWTRNVQRMGRAVEHALKFITRPLSNLCVARLIILKWQLNSRMRVRGFTLDKIPI